MQAAQQQTAPASDLPDILAAIYRELSSYYGPQHWWPTHSGSPWEIMLGAVLTQNTTWTNVELALGNILSAWGPDGLKSPEMALQAPIEVLTALLRPAGFYTIKPQKVRNLARFVAEEGGLDALLQSKESTGALRDRLLDIWGIGPETADAILLYALRRPVFVADAYTLRLASRWGLLGREAKYDEVQGLFADNLPRDTQLYDEYHALIIAHGKGLCRPRPRCEACPLNQPLTLTRPEHNGSAPKTWRCPRLYTPDPRGS